jgi:hypothetical protein
MTRSPSVGLLALAAALVQAVVAAWAPPVAAQAPPSLEVSASPASVTVGDPIEVTLELTVAPELLAGEPRFPVWGERWGALEIVEVSEVERIDATRAFPETRFRQRLRGQVFRPGPVELPPRTVKVPGRETTQSLATGAVPLTVRSVLPPPTSEGEGEGEGEGGDEAAETPPPKAPAAPRELPIPQAFWWTLGGLGLPVLALALLLLRGRRAPPVAAPSLAPLDELQAAVRAAEKEPSVVRGHTVLSMALRHYLSRRLGTNAVESTTPEIRRSLASKSLPRDLQVTLAELLGRLDRVKFAGQAADRNDLLLIASQVSVTAIDLARALDPLPPVPGAANRGASAGPGEPAR